MVSPVPPAKTGRARHAEAPPIRTEPWRRRVAPPREAPTRHPTALRILDAAEALFALNGFDGVSMRDITGAAGVPLNLSTYHFGTKERLFAAIFERRMVGLNARRMERLEALLLESARRAISLEEVLSVSIVPMVRLSFDRGGADFARIVHQVLNTPDHARFMPLAQRYFDTLFMRFIDVLREALPQHSEADLHWGLQLTAGVYLYAMVVGPRAQRLSGGACERDAEAVIARVTRFACAGLRAMHPEGADKKPKRPASGRTTPSSKRRKP